MAKYVLTLVTLLVFASHVPETEQSVSLAVSIGKSIFDVAKFSYQVYETLNEKVEDGQTKQFEKLSEDLSKKIDASTTTLIRTNLLTSKLELIDDTVVAVHSSLMDIKLMLTNNGSDREKYETLFKANCENSNLIAHLRFLPKLLTYVIPGNNGKLLKLWIENNRCNMTSLYVFKQFYIDLVSSGIGIEATYNNLKTSMSPDDSLEVWKPLIKDIKDVFDYYENLCKSRFETYVKEDILKSSSPEELLIVLDQRYPWKIHDILFLKSYGTFQFTYYESKGGLIIVELVLDTFRLVVSIDKDAVDDYYHVGSINGERFRSRITSEEDVEAAKNVGIGLKTYLKNQLNNTGYEVEALIAFFDESGAAMTLLNNDSKVSSTEVKDVNLKFCHKSGFECFFPGIPNNVHGNMKVFFYLSRNEDMNITTGAAPGRMMASHFNIVLMGLITACLGMFNTW